MMPHLDLNPWALLAASVAALIIAFAWYSPFLFGNQWIKLMGLDKQKKDPNASMWPSTIGQFLANLVMGLILALVFGCAVVINLGEALLLTTVLWLGFVVTVKIGSILWAKRPAKLFFIDVFGQLATMLAMGAILFLWG